MLVQEMVGGEPYEYYPLGQYIVRAIGVCGGRPTFKYTRIEVAGVLSRVAAGESLESIADKSGGRISVVALQEGMDIAIRHFLGSLPELTAA